MSHAYATLTPITRLRLARLVVDAGWTYSAAAAMFMVSPRTGKPFDDPQRFGLERARYFQQGKVVAPHDLASGQHELSVRITDPTGVFDDSIMFFVDPAGTGACLSQ